MKKIVAAMATLGALCAGSAFGAEMTVSAAASLTNAFNEIAGAFEKDHSDIRIRANYAASNPLLKQIEEGAPVDVFASADQDTMDRAERAKLIYPDSRRVFARNDLVLIVPEGGKALTLADLANCERIAIGDPESVPAGRYAKAALEKAGLWDKLKDRFVLASSVRQALNYVARGEADAGFVYATDAQQMADKVDVALAPVGDEAPVYPVAVVVTGDNPRAGEAFIEFLLAPQGQELLSKYGFARP